jgi:hypothetical protein
MAASTAGLVDPSKQSAQAASADSDALPPHAASATAATAIRAEGDLGRGSTAE